MLVRARDISTIRRLIRQVRVGRSEVTIICDAGHMAEALGLRADDNAATFELRCPARLARSGVAMRFVDDGGVAASGTVDLSLVKLVAKAHRLWQALRAEPIDIKRLAEREGLSAAYVTRVLRLAFLAPDVTEAILAGTQRASVSAAALVATDAIQADWRVQRATLQFREEQRQVQANNTEPLVSSIAPTSSQARQAAHRSIRLRRN